MKRLIVIIMMILVAAVDINAVLKEKDLESTLSILRIELTNYRRELSSQSMQNKHKGEAVHRQLISTLKKSNQNALMLYSQNPDYVFDMAYACHEATEQYMNFQKSQLPFRNYLLKNRQDIASYDSLAKSLRTMSVDMLSEKAKTDRNVCLTLATNICNTLKENNDGIEEFIRIYDTTELHLKEINDYANKRYNDIQTSIFNNGGDDYIAILKNIRATFRSTRQTVIQKYVSNSNIKSQWNSKFIFGLFGMIAIYGIVASFINVMILRVLMPRKFRTEKFMEKRTYIIMATTTVTFALILGIVRATTAQNFIIMASDLLVEYAWLLGVVLISLLLRLKAVQMQSGFRIYSPLIIMGFLVISFRIILIPNELVNLVFPPVLLLCALWQWSVIRRHNKNIPSSDITYTYISLTVFVTSVILSWLGYTLASVQLLIWWIMQLTCILTITCISRWITKYGEKKNLASKPISKTWTYKLLNGVLLPVMGVISVMISIYWAADVFNLSDLCWKVFNYRFVDLSNLKLSIIGIATVISLWFLFSYVCMFVKSALYDHFKSQDPNTADSRTMMAKNVIQVAVWGAWTLVSLSILGISLSWILVITGGLSTGIGFASKDIIENIYYGISLMAGRIKVGDLIECDGIRGRVSSISYTSTLLEATDGSVIAFQNSQLFTKNYKNLTRNHGFALSVILFGIGYGSNVKEVSSMIEKAVTDMRHPLVDHSKPVRVVFVEFGDNSVNLKLFCWVDVLKQVYAESDIKECIYRTLNENNVEIPFPQRDIFIKNIDAISK